jgi:trehalose 6-phosphate phosphatase
MDWQEATGDSLRILVEKQRLGLVTDMDGTLSPIVPSPDQAQITPRNRELLQALRPCLTLVAVVSGRASGDVRERVGLPDLIYVGNHGLEQWVDDHVELAPEAAAFRPALETALDELRVRQVPGMWIEDKGATLSVHYRQTENPQQVAADLAPIVHELAERLGLRDFQGRMVFELRPPLDINKGSILRRLAVENALESVVYLGDDTTDVDALRVARLLREQGVCYAVGLGVESEGVPEAVLLESDFTASGVAGVESFLAWLLNARRASSSCM